jgi:crotonobetainyl-CoA:carnitine CoA-transferase CaiB-like acyl-CoA transferase
MKDLDGLLVVSLEQAVAAPYTSCKLADAGARVIKVERPEGDFARKYDALVAGESSYFVWLNRGKESLCLDLKDRADLEFLLAIIAKADIFIQNLAPGAAARLGLGAQALTKCFPKLIYCSISGYGEEGPYRDQKAYDMLIQGESGLISVNGTPDDVARVGISICDITAGMTAYAAILQSLLLRARTGKGRTIEVSLFHAIADWMNVPYLQTRYGQQPPPRVGVCHPTIAPYGAFRCADGKSVLLSIQNEREWARFCADVLKDGTLAVDQRFAQNLDRVKNRAELDGAIAAIFATMTRERAIELLTTAGIACGRLSDMDDLVKHPQRRLITVRTAAGGVEMLAPGAKLSGDLECYGAVPSVGEHTAALREEFGPQPAARSAGLRRQKPGAGRANS